MFGSGENATVEVPVTDLDRIKVDVSVNFTLVCKAFEQKRFTC